MVEDILDIKVSQIWRQENILSFHLVTFSAEEPEENSMSPALVPTPSFFELMTSAPAPSFFKPMAPALAPDFFSAPAPLNNF